MNIELTSFVVLASLSCLYEDEHSTHARKILKPKALYTKEDAYNALSDINALELYVGNMGLAKEINKKPFALTTCDKALVAFGCGLNLRKFDFNNGNPECSFSISSHLFPRLPKNQVNRLGNLLVGNTQN